LGSKAAASVFEMELPRFVSAPGGRFREVESTLDSGSRRAEGKLGLPEGVERREGALRRSAGSPEAIR
jgi:hypothetical protein